MNNRYTLIVLFLLPTILMTGCQRSQGTSQVTDTNPDAQLTDETRQLMAYDEHLREDLIRVTDGVYTATGYSPANVSMIEGETGLIIVDAAMTPAHAKDILAAFRTVSKKPISALIYTHGHGDHTGGASAFVNENTQVWARPNINEEGHAFDSSGVKINGLRGARQGGFRLPQELRINNGVAQAFPIPKDRNAFAGGEGGFVCFDRGEAVVICLGLAAGLDVAGGGFRVTDFVYDYVTHRWGCSNGRLCV